MSSIRRLSSGISSPVARSIAEHEVASPIRNEPPPPVPPVRPGFSDVSDFLPDGAEGADALAPALADAPGELEGPSVPSALLEHAQLRTLAGVSDFEASRPRYAQVLGTSLPPPAAPELPSFRASALASMDAARGSARTEDAGALDPTDILSPEAAAWELQNLDTSTPTVHEPEDLLFMLDPPGSAGEADPAFEMGLDDIIDEASHVVGGLDAEPELLGAGSADFLADVNDVDAPPEAPPPFLEEEPRLAEEPAPTVLVAEEALSAPVDTPEASTSPEPTATAVAAPEEPPREA